jgi:hypothetical protein
LLAPIPTMKKIVLESRERKDDHILIVKRKVYVDTDSNHKKSILELKKGY